MSEQKSRPGCALAIFQLTTPGLVKGQAQSPCAVTLLRWRGLCASMILRAKLEGAYRSWQVQPYQTGLG